MPVNCLIKCLINFWAFARFVFKTKILSPLMPINCLVKCLINFWTFRAFRVPKQINGFLMNQFMDINVSKRSPFRPSSFALRLLSPPLLLSSSFFLSLPLSSSLRLFVFLSLSPFVSPLKFFLIFIPAHPANSLKTKDLRKRHFWLKFLSQRKPLRLKTLGAKFAQSFAHLPADPTLHTPPETDPTYSAAKPYIM